MPSLPANITTARVRSLCADRDWRLLNLEEICGEEEFLRRASEALSTWLITEGYQNITGELHERVIIYEYNKLLHAAVGQRNTPAWERALIELWNYVTPMIRKILRDDDRAQDVAMDVLIKVCEKRDQVRDPGSFLAWAGVIAHREAVHAAQAHAREVAMADLGGDDDDVDTDVQESLLAAHASGPPDGDPGAGVRRAELEARIRYCLRRMRHGAEVFIGLALHELPVSEIARRLGMKANAVYVIFHRARKRLQRCGPLLADLGVALEAQP